MKVQRPGPNSPGGPRVERICDVCRRTFWPRVVDVQAGKGKHCSSTCSSKALRKKRGYECAGCSITFQAFPPGRRFHSKACRSAWMRSQRPAPPPSAADRRRQRIQAVLSGKIRILTLSELARLIKLSDGAVRFHRDAGNLGKAWDGQHFDRDHSAAQAFLSRSFRSRKLGRNTPRPKVPCSVCGRPTPKGVKKLGETKTSYCGRKCQHIGQGGRIDVTCEQCGIVFSAVPSDEARFHSPECARLWSVANAPKLELAGAMFTLSELSAASGLSKACIMDRVRRGEPLAQAVTRKRHGKGRWKHTPESIARIKAGLQDRLKRSAKPASPSPLPA